MPFVCNLFMGSFPSGQLLGSTVIFFRLSGPFVSSTFFLYVQTPFQLAKPHLKSISGVNFWWNKNRLSFAELASDTCHPTPWK